MGVCQSQVSHSIEEQAEQCHTVRQARVFSQDRNLSVQKITPLVYISQKDLCQSLKTSPINGKLADEENNFIEGKSPKESESTVQTAQDFVTPTMHQKTAVVSVPVVTAAAETVQLSTAKRQETKTYMMQCGDILKEVPLLDFRGSDSSLLARRRRIADQL